MNIMKFHFILLHIYKQMHIPEYCQILKLLLYWLVKFGTKEFSVSNLGKVNCLRL